MTLGYGLRLALLAPASFFGVNLAMGLVVRLVAPWIIRRAQRLSAGTAANLLLAARLAPSMFALAAAAGLCVPSFLLHEQRTTAEGIGVACLLAGLLGIATWGDTLVRGARAIFACSRFLRHAEHARGLVTLAGVLHPRLVISRDVREALSPEELDVAVRHEHAHWASHDNLRHLLVLLTPSLLPGWRVFALLDRARLQFTEWAADDCAIAGNPRSAVVLADVLVRVSRLAGSQKPVPLAASLLDTHDHLESRVARLLNDDFMADARPSRSPLLILPIALLTVALPLLRPGALLAVHDLLERLIR